MTVKVRGSEVLNGKYTTRTTAKSFLLVPFTLLLIMLPLSLMRNSHESTPEVSSVSVSSSLNASEIKQCDIFSGRWMHTSAAPYYTNETCHWIIDQQNCMKFGRPDREYLHWRWKPDECELPLFNASHFLNLLRGKKMVFVGDSVGRNQMQSLLCLLSHVSEIPSLFSSFFKRIEAESVCHIAPSLHYTTQSTLSSQFLRNHSLVVFMMENFVNESAFA